MTTTFKTLEFGTIEAAATAEDEWTPDKDITIRKVLFNERTGASLNAVEVYIEIAGVPYTKPLVPASIVGTTLEYCWKPDLVVRKGAKIYTKLENTGASAVEVDLVFEYE
ncbi:MAG: hypothetical protein JRD89_05020 [Deltaproteobacteria bacterium]|nr:hypothetical protein [Deltaproteobacteria bacterium]